MDSHNGGLRGLLDGLSIDEFKRLPSSNRTELFKDHLTQENVVVIEEGDDDHSINPKIARSLPL